MFNATFKRVLVNLTFVLSFITATTTFANGVKIGDLVIHQPTVRATAPGAKVGGGYVVIENAGQTADRLIGGSAAFAGRVEIHQMKLVNDIMKMTPLTDGLEIPPGAKVSLKPGGNHIMFMKLDGQLKAGERRKATLVFQNAGKVEIEFDVKSIGDTLHKEHKHKH